MSLPVAGVHHLIKQGGAPLRLRYYTKTVGSVWDDEVTWAQSGADLYSSGTIHVIDNTEGSEDRVLLEQGRISYDDKKFYISGTFQTNQPTTPYTALGAILTIAISGQDRVYREITPGLSAPEFNGTDVYKKLYGRLLENGSLF